MKKFIPIVLVGILVLSGLGAAAFSTNVSLKPVAVKGSESLSVQFLSQPLVSEKDGFVEISVDGATTQLLDSNRPVLPIYVKTYQIPFGSTNIQVECTATDLGSLLLTQEVIPARIVPLSELAAQTAYEKDPVVYGSAAFYPATWFNYDLGAGRNERGQQVTFVKVMCYPVRYSPLNNQIEYAGGFDILVTYDQPVTPQQSSAEDYDMVIIAPDKFAASLEPLVEFKNGKGVMTKFKSVESILTEYDGFDPPEQIKNFIKNEYDVSHITYVLLVGQ